MVQIASVDVEISDVFTLGPGEDLEQYAPLHVCVAATVTGAGEARLWWSEEGDDRPAMMIAAQRARELLAYLEDLQRQGHAVCAWNGLGFDLKWIGHAAGDLAAARRVALGLYDPMFQFFNQRGFPVSLASVGRAMGVPLEKLMAAADAPRAWRSGEHRRVLDYVRQDAVMTNEIVRCIEREGRVRWVKRDGGIGMESMPALKTVAEVLALPEPDQSWMDRPLPRARFAAWLTA